MAQLKSTNIFGTLKVHALTQSTSIDTGALVVSGGVGIKKNLNVGGSATILGAVTGLTFNGTWNGNIIAISKGGTGLASTTARHALLGPSSAGAPTWRAITVADISDITSASTGITKVGTITTGVWKGTAIANDKLANSSVTVGTTNISLGGSSTTLAGLTSVTSTSFVGALTGNASTATKLKTTRAIALTGAVTGTANFDGNSDISIATTHTADPVITLTGDVSGSGTMTNLGSVSITATVADDSHNHVIGNIDGLGTALGLKAPLASPTLTGTPVAPTATKGTKTTQIATTAFVSSAISDLVDSSPETLDTLNELAAALGNDPNFATTVATEIGKKANKVSSPTTGNFAGLSSTGDLTDSGYNSASFTAASHVGTTGTAHGTATTSVNGFMSSADKTKLDGIAASANKYSLPAATNTTLGGVKIGTGISNDSGLISVSTNYQAPLSNVSTGADKALLNGAIVKGLKQGTNVTLSEANNVITINSSYVNTTYTAGTGLNLTGNAFSVKYGTAADTACKGNDSRLADVSDATNANTANMIVKRDASGNFSAGTITASLSGNAATATTATTATTASKVAKAITFNNGGTGADSGTTFNGSAAQTISYNTIGAAASSRGVPSGIIAMWSGLITAIPTEWFLCNGLNGTPDLRGRFIYGASIDADVKTTGGSADAIVVSHTHTGPAHTHTSAAHTHSTPNHTHTASSNSTGAHTHSLKVGSTGGSPAWYFYDSKSTTGTMATESAGAHSHTITVNSGGASTTGSTTPANTGSSGTGNTGSTGSSGTNANLPPYMKLAYIMKG